MAASASHSFPDLFSMEAEQIFKIRIKTTPVMKRLGVLPWISEEEGL